MSLFIPTSHGSLEPFADLDLTKGQLYNLDLNETLGFQFNPEAFEYETAIKWQSIEWLSSETGGDLQYIGSGGVTFQLPLLYIVQPGAPMVASEGVREIVGRTTRVPADFEEIEKLIKRWCEPLASLGRPSRIRVIIGPRYFDGVIARHQTKITEFFPDLTAKEALLTLDFRQWHVRPSES